MKDVATRVAHTLLLVLDFFYGPFRKFMPLQTFRYAASGGGNMILGFLVYSIGYTHLFKGQTFLLPFYAFKPHSASLLLSFCVTFPVGFFMSKYVVFADSDIRGRIQLFRYLMVCLFNLVLNYLLLKLLVERFGLFPVLAQLLTVALVVSFSYLAQRNFSFKATEKLP
ncbi:MAG: GtrA family protein [Sphingomonadales bacterium]